jgi:hypothetical protein
VGHLFDHLALLVFMSRRVAEIVPHFGFEFLELQRPVVQHWAGEAVVHQVVFWARSPLYIASWPIMTWLSSRNITVFGM